MKFQIHQYTTRYRTNLIIEAYRNWIKNEKKVLDIGCGNGVVSAYLQRQFSWNLTGCDIMKYTVNDIKFVHMEDKHTLPFKNNSFEIAMFNDMLHHMTYENQEKLIIEALRVANKVLIFDENPTLVGKLSDFLINQFHNSEMEFLFTFRTKENWEKLFKKLKVKSSFKKVHKALFYPFTHTAFMFKS